MESCTARPILCNDPLSMYWPQLSPTSSSLRKTQRKRKGKTEQLDKIACCTYHAVEIQARRSSLSVSCCLGILEVANALAFFDAAWRDSNTKPPEKNHMFSFFNVSINANAELIILISMATPDRGKGPQVMMEQGQEGVWEKANFNLGLVKQHRQGTYRRQWFCRRLFATRDP